MIQVEKMEHYDCRLDCYHNIVVFALFVLERPPWIKVALVVTLLLRTIAANCRSRRKERLALPIWISNDAYGNQLHVGSNSDNFERQVNEIINIPWCIVVRRVVEIRRRGGVSSALNWRWVFNFGGGLESIKAEPLSALGLFLVVSCEVSFGEEINTRVTNINNLFSSTAIIDTAHCCSLQRRRKTKSSMSIMPIDAKIVFATFFVRFQFPPILGLRFLFEPGLIISGYGVDWVYFMK